MKKIHHILPYLIVLFPMSLFAAEQGDIRLVQVVGQVTLNQKPVVTGLQFQAGGVLSTAAKSRAVLAFSNGIVVSVAENSSLELTQFAQEAKSQEPSFAAMKKEPSVSTTKLRLELGEIVAQTVTMNKNSQFEVSTQVGIAGIRGSTLRAIHDDKQNITRFSNVQGDIIALGIGPIRQGEEFTLDRKGLISSKSLPPDQQQRILQQANTDRLLSTEQEKVLDFGPIPADAADSQTDSPTSSSMPTFLPAADSTDRISPSGP